MKKILLGLTTTSTSDYFGKIEEAKKFNITEVAFFPTAVEQNVRKEIYSRLENSGIKSIPHVHLRDDMELWELELLENKYGTQVFNIHSKNNTHSFKGVFEKFNEYSQRIYIENCEEVPEKDELSRGGGLCIDFSHWQDFIMLGYPGYDEKMLEVLAEFTVGCSHISGVGKELTETHDAAFPEVIYRNYSKHTFEDLSEFDYIKKYTQYLPDLISLELENSFVEQLQAKAYLEKMIAG